MSLWTIKQQPTPDDPWSTHGTYDGPWIAAMAYAAGLQENGEGVLYQVNMTWAIEQELSPGVRVPYGSFTGVMAEVNTYKDGLPTDEGQQYFAIGDITSPPS